VYGRGGQALYILNLWTRWKLAAYFTLYPSLFLGTSLHVIKYKTGWAPELFLTSNMVLKRKKENFYIPWPSCSWPVILFTELSSFMLLNIIPCHWITVLLSYKAHGHIPPIATCNLHGSCSPNSIQTAQIRKIYSYISFVCKISTSIKLTPMLLCIRWKCQIVSNICTYIHSS
jgi:hypothetical protein